MSSSVDPPRVLITGIAGFAGSHLADLLLNDRGVEVHGVAVPGHDLSNLRHIAERIILHGLDLGDYAGVRDVLRIVRPEGIYHLAAQASVPRAWADPAVTLLSNIAMQLNVLRAMAELGLAARTLIVGSSDEYGAVSAEDLPIDEDTPLRPANPYAVSKVAQDYLALQYYLSHALPIIRVRPFNHIGPRQRTGFVVPDLARQLARIECGLQEPIIRVGNLATRRDFTDVRDTVCAYELALGCGEPGQVYNVGSSQAYAIREVLDMLLSLSHANVRIEPDPGRQRPSDTPVVVSDCRRLRARTGWEPRFTLSRSLADVLEYWRALVGKENSGGAA